MSRLTLEQGEDFIYQAPPSLTSVGRGTCDTVTSTHRP